MRIENSERILSTIRQIQAAEFERDVIDAFIPFVAQHGFTHVHLGQLVSPANVGQTDTMIVSTWPEELLNRRLERYDILHDPVALASLRTKRPFRWQKAIEFATRRGLKVIDQSRDYGITDGYMFPVHSLESVSGAVSLGGDKLDLSPRDISEIELVALTAYAQLESILGPFPYQQIVDLSVREAEVVQFVAAGKTNRDIATILGIQPCTVKETLQRASHKLGTLNRAHTAATAIAKNMIFP
ncbi:MAG: LuxR family transcriptional regulator [Pseudomonadota bacterium]